jgi:SprT protein
VQKSDIEKILGRYLPPPTVPLMAEWIDHFKIHLHISKSRASKLGDYRSPFRGQGHRISVNHNLNQYAFLITLVHEIAHLTCWEKNRDRVAPHGSEWKNEFKILMRQVWRFRVFPESIEKALVSYMQNPAASSCSDLTLLKELNKFDRVPGVFLDEIPNETVFNLNNRLFRKGEKLRKRYKCLELTTKRYYLISPMAEISVVTGETL